MRKRCVYIFFIVLLIFWICFSNTLIVAISGYTSFKEEKEYLLGKDIVFYAVDSLEPVGDLPEGVNINGWSFVETKKENSNRCISFILKNGDSVYYSDEIYDNFYMRGDVIGAFQQKNLGSNKKWGFNLSISTVNLKNGTYKLYIYCKENDENYGIADTGIWLKKEGRTIEQWDWRSEQVQEHISVSKAVSCSSNVDSISIDESMVVIQGWAFAKDLTAETQNVYAEMTNSAGQIVQYTTESMSRTDVGNHFGNDKYNMSGYRARIPVDLLEDGKYTLRILVENNGECWGSVIYGFEKRDGQIV